MLLGLNRVHELILEHVKRLKNVENRLNSDDAISEDFIFIMRLKVNRVRNVKRDQVSSKASRLYFNLWKILLDVVLDQDQYVSKLLVLSFELNNLKYLRCRCHGIAPVLSHFLDLRDHRVIK
jgi:hypothetical protein